jgi:hypothetical protein
MGWSDALSAVKYILSPLELYRPDEKQELNRIPLITSTTRDKIINPLKNLDFLMPSPWICSFVGHSLEHKSCK